MEESGRARRVTQRSLDTEASPPTLAGAEPASPAPLPPADSLPPPDEPPFEPLAPSDTELRKRQMAWFAERARHEAARRGVSAAGAGSK